MKFQFCGNKDCPDWILGEILTISKFSSVRMKLLCRQLVQNLDDIDINEKILSLLTTKRLKWKQGDEKALIAALRYILLNAVKFQVTNTILSKELQQLGLPNDICRAIGKIYQQNYEKIHQYLAIHSLSAGESVENIKWSVNHHLNEQNSVQMIFNLKINKLYQLRSLLINLEFFMMN